MPRYLSACLVLSVVPLVFVQCGTKPKPAATPSTTTVSNPTPATVQPGTPTGGLTETVKAEVGVGKQGRSLDEHEGMVVTPVKVLFATKERVVFEIQLPQALQIYTAIEGKGPATHEEFMEKIVAANNIKLPVLPAGHEYLFDPEQQALMVKRPAKAPAP